MMLSLLAAVAVGAFWAGKHSRSYPRADVTRPPATRATARDEVSRDPATPSWPWVAGAVIIGVLVLGMAGGPPVLSGGPGLFGGPGGLVTSLLGP